MSPAKNQPVDRATLLAALVSARGKLLKLLEELDRGQRLRLETLPNDPLLNELLDLKHRLSSRLTASRAINSETETRSALQEELEQSLELVTALLDEGQIGSTETTLSLDVDLAVTQYVRRATAHYYLDRLVSHLLNDPLPQVGEEGKIAGTWMPLTSLKGKNRDDLVRIITRTIPVQEQIDNDLSSLLFVLVRYAHTEPSLAQYLDYQDALTSNTVRLREYAESQQLREVVAGPLAQFLTSILSGTHPPAYDDQFRALYFTVVKQVQKYYTTRPPSQRFPADTRQPKAAPDQQPTESVPVAAQSGKRRANSTRREPTILPILPVNE